MRRNAFTFGAACALAACQLACARVAPPSAPGPVLHQPIELTLPSDSGALVSLPLANRSVTVLDAWAPSCIPCRQKVPALHARKADIEARGGKLVLVAVLSEGESTEAAKAALNEWGVSEPFLVDHGEVLRREAGVEALPATLVLDAHGVVQWVASPTSSVEDVVGAVAAAH